MIDLAFIPHPLLMSHVPLHNDDSLKYHPYLLSLVFSIHRSK